MPVELYDSVFALFFGSLIGWAFGQLEKRWCDNKYFAHREIVLFSLILIVGGTVVFAVDESRKLDAVPLLSLVGNYFRLWLLLGLANALAAFRVYDGHFVDLKRIVSRDFYFPPRSGF